jgi:NIPSNAP
MDHPTPSGATGSSPVDCCSVIELRQYTLHPGGREVLIDLFDREFRAGMEAAGMHVIGEFRDLDDPDRFVWMRGFGGMEVRTEALKAFYEESRTWQAHREQANATMIDSDDVLLLRPVSSRSGFSSRTTATSEYIASLVVATIYYFDAPVDEDFVHFFESGMIPLLVETRARPLGYFQTEPAKNTYPKLPVRLGENVFVWFSSFAGPDAHQDHLDLMARTAKWTGSVSPELTKRLKSTPQQLRLEPTAASRLR